MYCRLLLPQKIYKKKVKKLICWQCHEVLKYNLNLPLLRCLHKWFVLSFKCTQAAVSLVSNFKWSQQYLGGTLNYHSNLHLPRL